MFRPHGAMSREASNAAYDARRGSSTERGYDWRWRRARDGFIAEHPLCVMCLALAPPMTTPASVVDHKIPHRGDMVLFWDRSNWQSLCKPHHDIEKQREEAHARSHGG